MRVAKEVMKPLKGAASEDSTSFADPAAAEQKAAAEETGAHNAEALAHAIAHAEQDGAKEAREVGAEARDEAEKDDKQSGFFARMFAPKAGITKQQSGQPHDKQALLKDQKGVAQPAGKKPDAVKQPAGATAARPVTQATAAHPVHEAQAAAKVATQLSGTFARLERPPDAFALLKEAKEKGVLFQEDWERDGHTEDRDDPELAAAIEDVITKLFGKPGILRVGPGHNEQNEAVVVVVATHGFTENSLAAVPERSGRFPTLLALSFELLPLKRER